MTETGDEDSFSRNGERTKACSEAPDKVRTEQRGRQGIVLVSDGVHTHYLTSNPGFPNRYSKSAASARRFFQASFGLRAEPFGSPPPFLFSRIADKACFG